jgi:hypothetical protein
LGSRWEGVKCPICHRPFADCPHSVTQKEERERNDLIRVMIRVEVLQMKKEGLL